jgi:cell division protein ZipA
MDSLRLILLGIGIVVILFIYVYERMRRRGADSRYARFGGSNDKDFVPRHDSHAARPAFEDVDAVLSADLDDEPAIVSPSGPRRNESLQDITDELEQLEGIIAERDEQIERVEMGDIDMASGEENLSTAGKEPDMVVMINLFATDGRVFSGVDILDATRQLDLVFNDLHFFQRNDEQGDALFTMASAINPGTFELARLEDFTTRGLAFFMTLPSRIDPLEQFDAMLTTAREMEGMLHANCMMIAAVS